jgi:hypothetical protein
MKLIETKELENFSKDELIDRLNATNMALKAIYDYFDLLSVNYENNNENTSTLDLQSFIFKNGSLDNFMYQLQDAEKSTNSALFYLMNLEESK